MACLITMHIPDINRKFCIVNEILFKFSIDFHVFILVFSSHFEFWSLGLSYYFFCRPITYQSYLQTISYFFPPISILFSSAVFFFIYIWLYESASKFLSSVVFWPVSSFLALFPHSCLVASARVPPSKLA